MDISKIKCERLVDGKPCGEIMAEVVDTFDDGMLNEGYLTCPKRTLHDDRRPRILVPRDADRAIELMEPRPGIAKVARAANLPPAPKGFRHQAGCSDPRCDGQCVSSKETRNTPKEILTRAMGSLSDRSPIITPTSPFIPKPSKKR